MNLKYRTAYIKITIFRKGDTAGDTGPTVFITKGDRVRSGFTNDFLIKYVANPGSKIMANTNAFMYTETWEK